MTTPDPSSAAESSMDDSGSKSNGHNHRRHLQTLTKANSFTTAAANNYEDEGENFAEEGGAEVWGTLSENFRQVQSVLDRNRVLIQQVNENHQSKIHDNLVKNVALIQEINGNISKIVSLYSDLSVNFSSMFHQRNGADDEKSNYSSSKSKGDTTTTTSAQA